MTFRTRLYDATRNLVLFSPGIYDAIFDRVRYLIGIKVGIRLLFFLTFMRKKVASTLHNVIILIKSVFNTTTTTIIYS